jgi:hypothetical protein
VQAPTLAGIMQGLKAFVPRIALGNELGAAALGNERTKAH